MASTPVKRVAVKDRPFTRQLCLCLKNECFDATRAPLPSPMVVVAGTSSSARPSRSLHRNAKAGWTSPRAARSTWSTSLRTGSHSKIKRNARAQKKPAHVAGNITETDHQPAEDSEGGLPRTMHRFGYQEPTEVARGAHESPECPLQLPGS